MRGSGISTRQMITIINNPNEIICSNESAIMLDDVLDKLLTQRFPTIPSQLSKFCNQASKILQYSQIFIKKCLKDFQQKTIQFVLFPIRREFATVCKSGKPGPKARELMKAANCGNHARPGLKKCYQTFITQEMSILNATQKQKIPMICCTFHKLRECFISEAEEVKECTPRTITYISRWATEIYGELMDIMCFEYPDSSDRCIKVIDGLPDIDLSGIIKPKSFLSPLLKIFGDFDKEDAPIGR
ncbi:uncharacterized protein LOC128953806 [Oppia nitens]|uniref:uncharacterized protein LOC128953806 n=1 Tax=Oppia nitens TaxID=1686743 RepID=UPI0023DA5342|nr:uncharacterized protein LOC128953806 [Oppia nitens]